MIIRSILRLIKNLILFALSICSTSYICYAENSAQDLGGVSNNKMRQINTMKADHNLQLRQISSDIDESFAGLGQSSDQPKKLGIPQLSVIGKDGGLSASNVLDSASKPVDESVKSDETFDGYKEVNKLLKEYEELKILVKTTGSKRSQISDSDKKNEFDMKMQRLKRIGRTLQKVPDHYFSSDSPRPDTEKELDEVYQSLDRMAKNAWTSWVGDSYNDFLEKLKVFDKEQGLTDADKSNTSNLADAEVDGNSGADSKSDNKNNNLEIDEEGSEISTELSGVELIRSKCSGSVGSKNGAALVKHLTSGECAKAINENSDLKAEYNISKIVELISAWGFRTASFSSATNIKLGIDKLPELGIIFDVNNVKADFKPIPYQPAVEVQQTQLLVTQDESDNGPLEELMPVDKSVLGHSVRD